MRYLEVSENGDSELGSGLEGICSFEFTDFRRNGVLSLVAGDGVAKRGSCPAVQIIDKTPTGLEIYSSGGDFDAGSDVAADVRDLGHDGHREFLLRSSLGSVDGQCSADWTAIYAWTGTNYGNVSDQFKDFYRKRLDSINSVIPALQEIPGSSGYALRDKECLEAEAAAIQRFLGGSPEAGLEQAIRLAQSSNVAERAFAPELLGEIGTAKAREELMRLAKDPNYVVAMYAKYSLEKSANGPMKIVEDSFIRSGPVHF